LNGKCVKRHRRWSPAHLNTKGRRDEEDAEHLRRYFDVAFNITHAFAWKNPNLDNRKGLPKRN